MSDARLRELERRWKETGAVEDEAAWLRARVQAGELEESRLELAAHCGHEAAQALRPLTPQESAPDDADRDAGSVWTAGLVPWGQEALVRVGCAMIRTGAGGGGRGLATQDSGGTLDEVLELVEDWIVCPCPEHARACREDRQPSDGNIGLHHVFAWHVGNEDQRGVVLDVGGVFPYMSTRTRLSALRAEVIPWALGCADPIRTRVANRRGVEILPDDNARD